MERREFLVLEQLRKRMRVMHYGPRTEEAYCDWVRRFVLFHTHVLNKGAMGVKSPADCL